MADGGGLGRGASGRGRNSRAKGARGSAECGGTDCPEGPVSHPRADSPTAGWPGLDDFTDKVAGGRRGHNGTGMPLGQVPPEFRGP